MYTYYDDHIHTDSINLNITYHTEYKSCRNGKNHCYYVFFVFLLFPFLLLLLIYFKNNNKINKIVTTFDHFFKQNVENDNISRICIICYDNISYDDLIFTKCDHYYHESCIKRWLAINQVCPICKRQYEVNV